MTKPQDSCTPYSTGIGDSTGSSEPTRPSAPCHSIGSLASESVALLRNLARLDEIDAFYLAGSAALAVHLNHRSVRSVDLMSGTERLTSPARRRLLERFQGFDPDLRVETARDGYFYCRASAPSPHGTGFKLFFYPYPVTSAPCAALGGLEIASLEDLGLMKLAAIISRGTRRDFMDLHHLTSQLPLDQLLDRAAGKFAHVRDFPLQALKALADAENAVSEPLPKTHLGISWPSIAAWARGEARRLGRNYLGLGESKPNSDTEAEPDTHMET